MTPKMISAVEAAALTYINSTWAAYKLYMNDTPIPANSTKYSRIWVIASDSTTPMELGRGKSRNVGIIQLDVFDAPDIGSGPTGDVAMGFIKAFSRKDILIPLESGNLVLGDGTYRSSSKEGEYSKGIASIPYRYDFRL